MPDWTRRMRLWWARWWRQIAPKQANKPRMFYEWGSETDLAWIKAAFEDGQCPDCGHTGFTEGPSGGMCTNIQCNSCGQAWNHCGFIVNRNPWNQFQWPSSMCTACSGSGEVSGDMHGQHYHCSLCKGHGYILLPEPHTLPSGGSNAQPPKQKIPALEAFSIHPRRSSRNGRGARSD